MISANVENIKWSLITPEVKFIKENNLKEIIRFRRENLSITQMIWITKQPVMDYVCNLYNPKTLIMKILN